MHNKLPEWAISLVKTGLCARNAGISDEDHPETVGHPTPYFGTANRGT